MPCEGGRRKSTSGRIFLSLNLCLPDSRPRQPRDFHQPANCCRPHSRTANAETMCKRAAECDARRQSQEDKKSVSYIDQHKYRRARTATEAASWTRDAWRTCARPVASIRCLMMHSSRHFDLSCLAAAAAAARDVVCSALDDARRALADAMGANSQLRDKHSNAPIRRQPVAKATDALFRPLRPIPSRG